MLRTADKLDENRVCLQFFLGFVQFERYLKALAFRGRSALGAFVPAGLTTRPAESEHLEGKSTTTHYLVNSNKVCENSL
ncbi:hypothetical protein SB775_08220 [Peribacillus sp. SIMBA_075]|uniref:hypothetical protein n=1 Tax=Peribacillus sp. SIMBA_075 TaxID=3085813 RepID=UPI00397E507B